MPFFTLDRAFQGVYVFFLVVSLILLLSAASLPTWFNSDTTDGSCGPLTYSTDRTKASDIHIWSEYLWEFDVDLWMYSAAALCISILLVLASGFAAISPCCCCSCCLNSLVYTLATSVVLTVLGVILFTAGLAETSLKSGTSDEPANPEVFDICPCERATAFQSGSCSLGLGLLMGACAAVTTTVCAVMEWLQRGSRSSRIHPLDDEDRLFYE